MHEWALAESILVAAVEVAEKEKLKKISEINIGIGELQQISRDIFEFALAEVIKDQDYKLKNAKINITIEKSTLSCNNCKHVWDFKDIKKNLDENESESIHFLPEVAFVHSRCPKCSSPDFEIKEGRGVSITQIKGEK